MKMFQFCRKHVAITHDIWSFGGFILIILIVNGTDKTSADVIYFDVPSTDEYRVPCKSDSSKGPVNIVTWAFKGSIVAQVLPSNSLQNCTKYCVELATPYALRVSSVSVNDSGEYQCTLAYAGSSFLETRNVVVVRVAPAAPNIVPYSPKLLEGVSSTLTCTSSGHPSPNITWFKSGLLLQNNVTFTANPSGEVFGSILFSPSSTDDGAFLTCVAQNELGIRNMTVPLNVSYGPKNIMIGPSHLVTVFEEADAALNCSAEGKPTPLLSWKYANISGTFLLLNGTGRVYYVLRNVRRQDAGTYECVAANMFSNSSSNLTLDVKYMPRKPVVQSKSSSYLSGDNITLLCVTDDEGNPSAVYNWTKDGTAISATLPANMLNLSMATARASGSYACVASNIVGLSRSESFNLSVFAKPVVFAPEGGLIGYIGQSALLNCSADGNPSPAIYWLRSISDVQRGNASSYSIVPYVTTNVLRIDRIEQSDYGVYTCYANNSYGNNSVSLELARPSVPQAPWNLIIVAAKWSTVMLTWVPLFNGGYDQWFIVYSNDSTAYNGSVPSCTLTKLEPGVYVFYVKAHNLVGSSNSSAIQFATLADGPSAGNFSFSSPVKLLYTSGLEYCLDLVCSNLDQPESINNCSSTDADAAQNVPACTTVAARWCLVDIKPLLCGPFTNISAKGNVPTDSPLITTTHIVIIVCVVVGVFLIVIVSVVAIVCVRRSNSAKSRQAILNASNYDTSRSDALGLTGAAETPYATFVPSHVYPNPNFVAGSDDGVCPDDNDIEDHNPNGGPPRHDYVYAPVRRLAAPHSAQPTKALPGYDERHASYDDLDGSNKDDTSSVSEPPPYQPQVSVADSDNASAADSKQAKRVLYEVIV